MEPNKRPKPQVIENIPFMKRKEQSIYKPTDLWSTDDDLLFLRYCPSKHIKCYIQYQEILVADLMNF